MQQKKCIDIIAHNTLLKGYCSSGDLQGASNLIKEMQEAGFQPNDVSYNCLINAAVRKGDFKEVWKQIDIMKSSGVAVDRYTITIMMQGLKKGRDSSDVEKALLLMDHACLDVCSDEVLFRSVLETCVRHRMTRRIADIIDALPKSKLRPSEHTYVQLIKGCSVLKKLEKCWALWHDMVDHRTMAPNSVVLGSMLDALVCNGCVDDAVKLFREWSPRVPPNVVMYSILVKGFANSSRPAEALDLWQEMQDMGLPISTAVYNALIDSQACTGDIDVISKLVVGMGRDGCTPDAETYTTMVKAYCRCGELDKAIQVLRDMQHKSMTQDPRAYNTLLDGLARQNRMDLVDNILEDMEKFKIRVSSSTLSILAKIYGRCHQVEKAFQVVYKMSEKHRIPINAQVNTSLLGACIASNEIDRACKAFRNWQASGQVPDVKAYEMLISACVKQGRVEQARCLAEEVCDFMSSGSAHSTSHDSWTLNSEPFEHMIRALVREGRMETDVVPLMRKLRSAGIPLNNRLVSSLGRGSEGHEPGR
jgi:leucine-rich PPR motif-containing protein